MGSDPTETGCGKEETQWPATAIFSWGTLGGPAARRYHVRCFLALTLMVVSIFALFSFRHALGKTTVDLTASLLPGAAFLYIVFEFRRYLARLDELARRIQLESIAWTYLSGLGIAMFVGGLGLVYDWHWNAMWFVLLEPVRSIWLFVVSRRYQ